MEMDYALAYTYDGSLEGLLSAVFEAYARRENPADIVARDEWVPRIGQCEHWVETDAAHALRVKEGLEKTCGARAFDALKAVFLSDELCKGSAILAFVRYGMKRGMAALDDISHPAVEEFVRINRSVYNERHLWQQFMRFSQVEGGVYVARCNPKASVVPLLMDWFSGRFNTQAFVIYDEVHRIAGVSNGGAWQLVKTDVFEVPSATEDNELFERAWKAFYDAVAVEARYNPELRRQFMPKRMWKNIVEMKDGGVTPRGCVTPCRTAPRLRK